MTTDRTTENLLGWATGRLTPLSGPTRGKFLQYPHFTDNQMKAQGSSQSLAAISVELGMQRWAENDQHGMGPH